MSKINPGARVRTKHTPSLLSDYQDKTGVVVDIDSRDIDSRYESLVVLFDDESLNVSRLPNKAMRIHKNSLVAEEYVIQELTL